MARTIVVDARCLQDPNYARRGVGRHVLALLRHVPRGRGIDLLGLVDPALPALIEEAREVLPDIVPNAYRAGRGEPGHRGPDGFVALSPMTHDPLFTARLMADPRLLRAAVVYDFIPRREPERYLPGPGDRLGYAAALRWLARAELFAPISRSAADDLSAMLGVPAEAIAVTGAPVDPKFEQARRAATGRPRRHVLVVGGGDPRKNPEVVVRAHARSGRMQHGAGVPLVIGGNYGDADALAFRAIAEAAGGRPDLVEVPGHISEAALLELYGLALVIVCPSRDEGFSLPVVEGMAAGAPCLASDIPAHRELVLDPARRFAPGDPETLTGLLERVLDDAGWRASILERQAEVWPRFRAREVGRRFWDALLERLDARPTLAAPAVSRGSRARVALLSPLPPDRSGVADYTAATCADLGRVVDLHVFSETEGAAAVPGAATVRPLSALPHLMPGFDRVISVVGNSHFHLRIFEMLRRYGGACVAHDARMLGFYRILLGQQTALDTASRELGRPVSEAELNGWLADEGKLEALFLGDIAESATPMVVHSPVTAREVAARHGVAPVYLPFSIYRPWPREALSASAREEARARLGLVPGSVAIVTFGFVHASKAPEDCVWALELLRGWGVPASLHFVGGTTQMPNDGADLRALVGRLGLEDHVRFAQDYVPERTYADYLLGADLAVQLRTYGLGGLSGALLDCAAVGLPTVTNAALGEAVGVPPGYVWTIPDALSPLLLAEALANQLDAGLARRPLEDERRDYSERRSFAVYARGLCEALGLELPAKARGLAAA